MLCVTCCSLLYSIFLVRGRTGRPFFDWMIHKRRKPPTEHTCRIVTAFWISNVFLMIMNDKVNIHMSEGEEYEWVPIVSTKPLIKTTEASLLHSCRCVVSGQSEMCKKEQEHTSWWDDTSHDPCLKKKKVISTFLLFVTGWLHDTHTSTYLSVWPLWTCKFDFYLLTSCQRVDVLSVLQTCYL